MSIKLISSGDKGVIEIWNTPLKEGENDDDEKEEILTDLSDMWVVVAGNSETLQYTIYKLSNPDENKPDESIIKNANCDIFAKGINPKALSC